MPVTRFDLSNRNIERILDCVAKEAQVLIQINDVQCLTIACTPMNLKELVVGHLLSEGLIKSLQQISDIGVEGNICSVTLSSETNVEELRGTGFCRRVLPPRSDSQLKAIDEYPTSESDLRVTAGIIVRCVKQLDATAEMYKLTGGVHSASIHRPDGDAVALAEDVGRHNAVDKAIGMAALAGIKFADCFLVLSGRMSRDIVLKAARVGLPIVASLATALESGIAVANESGLTLAGFVRRSRMNVYTFPERIIW